MKKIKGFTLIEILIVLTIIVILALIALALYRNQTSKALDARRKADLQRIQIAIEEYEKDHNCYPPPNLVMNCDPGIGLRPYLDKIPCDPVTNAPYFYDYDISNNTCALWYRMYTNLSEAGTPAGPNGDYNYNISSPNAPTSGLIQVGGLYGCKGGFCVPVLWNSSRPGPECDPTFKSATCYGQCGISASACITWKK